MYRILTVGTGNIDFVQNVDVLPGRGETVVTGEKYAYVAGGKGGNCAIAAARLGADSLICARTGSDGNGRRLRKLWENEGIDCRFAPEDKSATGLASIIVETSGGENRIIVYPGANANLAAADVEDAMTCHPDAVLVCFESTDAAVYAAVKFANEQGVPVFADGGPAKPKLDFERLGHLTVFSPNESETEAYTGILPNNVENCLRASIRLSALVDADYIVLKLGARGAYIYDRKLYRTSPPFPVEAVDSTAAGDVFTAALTLEYLRGGDIAGAVRFACAAGALTVSKSGASTSIPTAGEVAEFLQLHGSM